MPSRSACRVRVRFEYLDVEGGEIDGRHCGLLGSIDLRVGFPLKECPATVVSKMPLFSLICDHCDIFVACPFAPRLQADVRFTPENGH
jgi:hypothetical protein